MRTALLLAAALAAGCAGTSRYRYAEAEARPHARASSETQRRATCRDAAIAAAQAKLAAGRGLVARSEIVRTEFRPDGSCKVRLRAPR